MSGGPFIPRIISHDEIERRFEMMSSKNCSKSIRQKIRYFRPGESSEKLYERFKRRYG